MNRFNVRIVEDNADTSIYTDVTKIGIVDDTITIDYEDGKEQASHQLNMADEVTIKASR